MKDTIQPIDIVIAWVDGNDIDLKIKRQQFTGQQEA